MSFINELTSVFTQHANAVNAIPMEAYMKGLFKYHGIKTNQRRRLFKEVWNKHKDEVTAHPREIALELYNKTEREYHYCGIEILMNELKKKFVKEDIKLIEKLIITHSWWDSVDVIAKYLLGEYLKQYPAEIPKVISRFSDSDNMWLNRSAILFQLGYKKDTDEALLYSEALKHRESKEFFIQKAIGWALREYGKTNPGSVRKFVESAKLKPLSTREALKNL